MYSYMCLLKFDPLLLNTTFYFVILSMRYSILSVNFLLILYFILFISFSNYKCILISLYFTLNPEYGTINYFVDSLFNSNTSTDILLYLIVKTYKCGYEWPLYGLLLCSGSLTCELSDLKHLFRTLYMSAEWLLAFIP